MMFAVIKTGGKQYKVAANDVLKIEKLDSEPGDVVTFDQVLMVGEGNDVTIGAPIVAGALVAGQLVETRKQKTIIVFKKERRHNYRRRNGHRQLLSTVRITEILTGGAKVTTQPDERAKARFAAAQQANAPAAVSEPAAKKAAAPKAEAPVAESKPAKAPKAKPAVEAANFVDDVKLIGGVGPALEKKLVAAGVTSLNDIAAWTADDVAKYDAELELHGRAERDEWVEQAKNLVAGKPPRAKADQELLASKRRPTSRPRSRPPRKPPPRRTRNRRRIDGTQESRRLDRNGRDTAGRRLGVKKFGGEAVIPGNIIIRQRGTKWHPGNGVGMGIDHTIFAIVPGTVTFQKPAPTPAPMSRSNRPRPLNNGRFSRKPLPETISPAGAPSLKNIKGSRSPAPFCFGWPR